ncbi:MAG: 50S ribosomal protein L15 [Candidatus Parcubacteria bacterium]|nr:MAG: 50S ribosomal protein L15 [Candidatus Parcubacteria bacterium]
MQINQLNFRLKKRKRLGRGGKRGNYSGRGMKGQKSRAGHRIRPALRDFILKIPKKRGMGNIKLEKNIFEVNLDKIDKNFQKGELVNVHSLKSKKILNIPKGIKTFKVKILSRGKLSKSLIFDKNFLFSKKTLEKIKSSNSKIE